MIKLVPLRLDLLKKYSKKKSIFGKILAKYKSGHRNENPKLIPYILKNLDKSIGIYMAKFAKDVYNKELTMAKKYATINNLIYILLKFDELGIIKSELGVIVKVNINYINISKEDIFKVWDIVSNKFQEKTCFIDIMKATSSDKNEILSYIKGFYDLNLISYQKQD